MELLKTSKLIHSMFEDEISEGSISIEDIDFSQESRALFTLFSSNKILKIDYGIVNELLVKFDILYKKDFFKNFKEPTVQEYFCQQLNFLLLIDFILSFFRIDNNSFNVKTITTEFIFEFFVKLGDFYSFINYLDVDKKCVDYLKFMITLYALHLQRDAIETNFHNNIEILDNFFANEVMPKVFREIKHTNIGTLENKIDKFNGTFKKELEEYNPTIHYRTKEFDFLNGLFALKYDMWDRPSISVKTTQVEVDNPISLAQFNAELNSDSDDDDDDYYSDEEDVWTPTIKKQIPNIEESDPNYQSYRKTFIFMNYQELSHTYDCELKDIRTMCSGIRIKDYANLPDIELIYKVKTILGVNLDLTLYRDRARDIFILACEYGHLEIVQNYVEFMKGELSDSNIDTAASSPNREILKFLNQSRTKYTKLNNILGKYKESIFYEPKIKIEPHMN